MNLGAPDTQEYLSPVHLLEKVRPEGEKAMGGKMCHSVHLATVMQETVFLDRRNPTFSGTSTVVPVLNGFRAKTRIA